MRAAQPLEFLFLGDGAPASTSEVRVLTAEEALPASELMLMGTSTLNGETFPELSALIAETAWPAVTSNVESAISSSVGEDYRGPQCS